MGEEGRLDSFPDNPALHDVGDGAWLGVGYDAECSGWRVERYIGGPQMELVKDTEHGGWRLRCRDEEPSPPRLLWRGTHLYRDEREARDKAAELAEKWRKSFR